MKIIIDDTAKYVSTNEQDYKVDEYKHFYDMIEILLTENQFNIFIGNETKRIFQVSQKRFNKFPESINASQGEKQTQ